MCSRPLVNNSILISCLFSLFACSENKQSTYSGTPLAIGEVVDTHFQSLDSRHFSPPIFTQIDLHIDKPGEAIWGATGRDKQGNIYLGVSTNVGVHDSAYLLQYNPVTGTIVSQSDTLAQLKVANVYFTGLSQNKLHSKFMMAEDGYLYFSSFDDTGESRNRNSVYGGNLWRKLPEAENWEHLLTTEEGLMAVQTHGDFVYALGHWGHVLHQYDRVSQRSNRLNIGAISGHRSRNFIVNKKGHIFIPRVETSTDGQATAVLVEVNASLAITDIHPLPEYVNLGGLGDHGIIAYTIMKNGEVYFTVASGGLYHISESSSGRHEVTYLGKFEPQFDNSYIASLFSPDGKSLLVGLGRNKGTSGYYWFIRELTTQVSVNYPISGLPSNDFLLYGTYTTDAQGNMYIVGRDSRDRSKHKPILIQARYPEK